MAAAAAIPFAGCGEDGQGPRDLGPSAAPASLVRDVPAGTETPVSLDTPANAWCTLRRPGDTGGLRVRSDQDGQAVVHLTARSSGTIDLDCAADTGATTHQTLTLQITSDAQRLFENASRIRLTRATSFRPALANPMTATAAQLEAGGFPPRPDATAQPALLAKWIEAVSSPATVIEAPGAIDTGRRHAESPYWSGFVQQGGGNVYTTATAYWTVPSVVGDGTLIDESSLWVGLDGWGNNVVVQDGTDQFVYNFGALGSGTSYSAWTEYYPTDSYTTPLPVYPGDTVYISASLTDSAGNRNPNGGWGSFYLQNITRALLYRFYSPAPCCVSASGISAEVVMENPDYGQWHFSNYGSATATGGSVNTAGTVTLWGDGPGVGVYLYNGPTGHLLSTVARGSAPGQAHFTWHGFW
jgi:hypothetical protein